MALPLQARAPDPSALAAYWAEYEDLCRQICAAHDEDDNNYEGKIIYTTLLEETFVNRMTLSRVVVSNTLVKQNGGVCSGYSHC